MAHVRSEYPEQVRFATYTLKYPGCQWLEILGMERHYQKAFVDAQRVEGGFTIKTGNVRVLRLNLPDGISTEQSLAIDGQKVVTRPIVNQAGTYQIFLQKRAGGWVTLLPQRLLTERAQQPQKVRGLTGPIDDAFTDAFLCVRGTGKPFHEATQQYAEKNLERFEGEWAKYFRGALPIKQDLDVSADDIATRHLILFGDPSSNSLIGQALDGLPLTWTKDEIGFAGKKYAAAEHVPTLIYPNPLNAGRYVVLNSGHTFHATDFQGTNALLYPRLGDYAMLKLAPTEKQPLAVDVITSGLFNDFWKLEK